MLPAILLTLFIIGFYMYLKWHFNYWERKGIPNVKPKLPYLSSASNTLNSPISFGEQYQRFYSNFRSLKEKHLGIYSFGSPMYIPLDIGLVKDILQKDFDYFISRGIYHNEKDDPLSGQMFSLDGSKWRSLRLNLSRAFTSGKMKMLFPILVECGYQLKDTIDAAINKNHPVDIKELAGCFTTSSIVSSILSIECNCFKDINGEFKKHGKRSFNLRKLEIIKLRVAVTSPNLARHLGLTITPDEVTRFFLNVTKDAVNYRRDNNIVRKDVLQLLMDIRRSVKDDVGLTNGEMAAQIFSLFLGGYETSLTTMSCCLTELALNQDIQQRVRDEIEETLSIHNNEMNYTALQEMRFMEYVIKETLRKYPPVPFLTRKCEKLYKISGSDLILDKDTKVVIPVLGMHMDPEYFPNPERFDPDRFSKKNKNGIVPLSFLPFGDGPRNCIGLRFAMINIKIGLAVLLRDYKFSLNDKVEFPLKLDPNNLALVVVDDLLLNAEKIGK